MWQNNQADTEWGEIFSEWVFQFLCTGIEIYETFVLLYESKNWKIILFVWKFIKITQNILPNCATYLTCLVFGRKSFATKAGIIVISIKFIDGRSGPFAPCAKMHSPSQSKYPVLHFKRLLVVKLRYCETTAKFKKNITLKLEVT